MFSDDIHELISKLCNQYLFYDNYSFIYKEQVINALAHLHSILYKLDVPIPYQEDLPIGVFKILAQNQIEKKVFQKANCILCLTAWSYCDGCRRFEKTIDDFKEEYFHGNN